MNFKSILLMMPLALMGTNQKQLIESKKLKEKEIASLIKLIDEKEALVDSIHENGMAVYEKIIAQLSDEGLAEYRKEVEEYQALILEHFKNNKDLIPLLKTELKVSNDNFLYIKRMKYIFIRFYMEYMALHELITQYEKTLNDLLITNNQLNSYEN